jgi:hypothetical protein
VRGPRLVSHLVAKRLTRLLGSGDAGPNDPTGEVVIVLSLTTLPRIIRRIRPTVWTWGRPAGDIAALMLP